MELERYHQSFDEQIESLEEEAESRLRAFRQQCVRNFINNFTKGQLEWDAAYREILCESQNLDIQAQQKLLEDTKSLELALKRDLGYKDEEEEKPPIKSEPIQVQEPNNNNNNIPTIPPKETQKPIQLLKQPPDPFPRELSDYFTNNILFKEFIQTQQQLDTIRQNYADINTTAAMKPFKTELNLFIRTQINSISNSDREHLNTKTRMLTNLLLGQQVHFRDRMTCATHHPHGQMYAMDLAAQTFVSVGTRLVNSVPAIANSMATVINDIMNTDNLQHFKQLIHGNLQERCPYLIPIYPRRTDFEQYKSESEIKYKIACGYSYDINTKSLESEEKYLARMRSMVLIFACILAQQRDKGQSWSWLASFLSLKPEPVITATILQAYLQEISKTMSRTYGRQYKKLLLFIKTDYLTMIEAVTKNSDRQSLIKLQNLLSDESNLIAGPTMSSLFGAVRYG